MYKVFINDKPLFLTNKLEIETNFKYYLLNNVNLSKIISKYYEPITSTCVLYSENENDILEIFKSKLSISKAAGGKVFNKNGDVLFIFRNNKWDLPKGGIEKNENSEQAAIREVEEETGCKNLRIIKKLDKTYHIFKRNGEYKLKITQWYEMLTDYTGKLQGQENEGIMIATFVPKEKIYDKLCNSYENIKNIFI